MTKFQKAIAQKEETLNQKMRKKNIEDANVVLDGMKELPSLMERYSKLSEKVYGSRRKFRGFTLDELRSNIKELEDILGGRKPLDELARDVVQELKDVRKKMENL